MVAFVPPRGNEKPLGPWTNWIQLMKLAATCKEDFKTRSLILEYL